MFTYISDPLFSNVSYVEPSSYEWCEQSKNVEGLSDSSISTKDVSSSSESCHDAVELQNGKNETESAKRKIKNGKPKKMEIEKTGSNERENTTVMMRNIPSSYKTKDILDLLHRYEYIMHVDFVYVPIDFHTKINFGYAFLNFVQPTDAFVFKTMFQGFNNWLEREHSHKKVVVIWSAEQGSESRIEKYRSSALMHDFVPQSYKPALLKNGEVLEFPAAPLNVRLPKKFPLSPFKLTATASEKTIGCQ